jgi:arginine repressor
MSDLKLYKAIRKIMVKRKFWKSHDLQKAIAEKHKLYSESTITRRLREMPDVVASRPTIKGETSWNYRIIT